MVVRLPETRPISQVQPSRDARTVTLWALRCVAWALRVLPGRERRRHLGASRPRPSLMTTVTMPTGRVSAFHGMTEPVRYQFVFELAFLPATHTMRAEIAHLARSPTPSLAATVAKLNEK